MKIIIWILRFFWPSAAAAFQAYLDKDKEIKQEAVKEADAVQEEIVRETEDEVRSVPDKTDDELTDSAIDLGLVSDDSKDNPK